jgi:hypothetical protein
MIPKVLDTQRIARIIGEDDEQQNVIIDPKNPYALTKYKDDQGAMKLVFNPNIGTYDVYTTTGPSFMTRRVEAVEAMMQMTQTNPQLWQVIGDLLVKNMDWPGAEDISKRLKLTLLPAVQADMNKDKGAPEVPPEIKQAMDQMQQQIQKMGDALGNAGDYIDKLEANHEAAENANDIAKQGSEVDRFKAETDRLKLVLPYLDQASLSQIAQSVGLQAITTPDIAPGPMPDEQEVPDESQEQQLPPEQPAQADEPALKQGAFLTPENGQQLPALAKTAPVRFSRGLPPKGKKWQTN